MEPIVIVKDNFYKDPETVVSIAKSIKYIEYEPHWYSSALTTKYGKLIENKFDGYRYNDNNVIQLIENVINKKVDMDTWYTGGDMWNGAFHMKFENDNHKDLIHHHYKDNDCPRGYSGVVYLNTQNSNSGTKIWKQKCTGKITGNYGPFFSYYNSENWELYKHIAPKYNRLVLFKGDVYHSGDGGFGSTFDDCRLFQTFFFNVQ